MNTEHTQLPSEVREAIYAASRTINERLNTNHYVNIADIICAALAPLWPKPAPAPSDADVAAAVERLKYLAELNIATFDKDDHADIRTVLAALKHQHQCLERLHPYGREEIAELQAKLAEAQRDRERLIEALRGAGMTIAANLGDNHPRLKEIDAAMQEARR